MGEQRRIEPRRLKGFRDYLPAVCEARYGIVDAARMVAKRFAFQMVSTPCLEYAEVLLGQGSDETDKQVYRFKDHGDREVALRFDLTVPFARFVAEHQNDLVFPFRRMQIGEVWRGENTQKGRYREFCQCDVDIIGEDSLAADAEILLCFQAIISALDVGTFTIRVGNRPILAALINGLLFKSDPATSNESAVVAALIWVDKLLKIGLEETVKGLSGLPNAHSDGARELLALVDVGGAATDLSKVRAALTSLPSSDKILPHLDRFEALIARCQKSASGSAGKIQADISIARGLGYYTGAVFETFLDSLPGFGSIASGGRYDDLASRFSSRRLPGVGGSLGVDRLIGALEELDRIPKAAANSVFVAVASEDAVDYAWEVVMLLRNAGMPTDMALKTGKLGNQFKFADRMGYATVVTLGSDEAEARTVAIKDMREGKEQKGVPLAELAARLKSRQS